MLSPRQKTSCRQDQRRKNPANGDERDGQENHKNPADESRRRFAIAGDVVGGEEETNPRIR